MKAPVRARQELARGWSPLLAATLGAGMGASSILYYSFGIFVEPLQQAFAWSRGEVTSSLLWGSLGLILVAPVLGILIDRAGPRTVALWAVPGFALMLVLLSRFEGSLPLFYLLFFATTVVGSGTTPILYTREVAGRFDAGRGLALGITLCGPGTAAIIMPPLMTTVITDHGWRTGFEMLAALALLPWLLVWKSFTRGAQGPLGTGFAAVEGAGRREALVSRPFWTIVAGFGAVSVGCSALVVHLVPMLRDTGMSPAEAARIASWVGFGVVLGRLAIGWSIDRFFAPHVAAVIFVAASAGCSLLIAGQFTHAGIAAFVMGFALGAEVDLLAFLTSRYFGLRHYGFLYAVVYALFWIGIAIGPAAAGRLFDQDGNYARALWMIAGSLLLGALLSATLPRYATGRA